MKRIILTALSASVLLAGCAKVETIRVSQDLGTAIGFESFVDKSTKSAYTETNLNYLQSNGFYVFGTMVNTSASTPDWQHPGVIFTGKETNIVTYNQSTSKWTYSPLRYWIGGNTYSFSAVGPVLDANTGASYLADTEFENEDAFKNNYHGKIIIDLSERGTGQGCVDVVWDSKHLEAPTNAAEFSRVGFSFKHMLSRVRLQFVNGFPSNASTIEISDVQVEVKEKCELVLSKYAYGTSPANMAWETATGDHVHIAHNFLGSQSKTGESNATSKKFSMNESVTTEGGLTYPSQAEINIKFTASLYTGSQLAGSWEHEHSINLGTEDINAVFKPGYSYTLIANLDQDNIANDPLYPIQFDVVAIDGWDTYLDVDWLYIALLKTQGASPVTVSSLPMSIGQNPVTLNISTTPAYDNTAGVSAINQTDLKYYWTTSDAAVATVTGMTGTTGAVEYLSSNHSSVEINAEGAGNAILNLYILTKNGEWDSESHKPVDGMVGCVSLLVTIGNTQAVINEITNPTLAANALEIDKGESETISITGYVPAGDAPTGESLTYVWESMDTGIATVAGDGDEATVTAVTLGETFVNVTVKDGETIKSTGTVLIRVK